MLARRAGGFKTSVALPNIGDSWLGGYYAGIINTTKGNIIAADAFQTGQRFAVIVAPKSLEASSKQYKNALSSAPAQAQTRWNGLDATAAMNSSTYPAAFYCAGLTKPSGDDASAWYLPAIDELELLWRNLKPITDNNSVGSNGDTFPGSFATGYNPSSDPTGVAYTSSVPAQTTVAAFKTGGAQAMAAGALFSATEGSSTSAWYQRFDSGWNGMQSPGNKTNSFYVRPVRRLVLT